MELSLALKFYNDFAEPRILGTLRYNDSIIN